MQITRKAVALCVLSVLALDVFAQDATRLESRRGVDTRSPIAVPDFVTDPGQERLGQELAAVIANDLDFTGQFRILPRERYPVTFTGFTADLTKLNFDAWKATGVEFLVYAYVSIAGGRVSAECRLFDVQAGEQIVGKKFDSEQKWSRLVAHQFSDEIVGYLTGVPGIASSQIAFSGGAAGKKEIYVADYDGHNVVQVTRHGSLSVLPVFSPDGKKLAYLSYKDRYPFLYVLDLASGASRALSKNVGLNMAPAWSPNGEELAIVLSKDANPEIYLVSASGANPRRLTNDKAIDSAPDFHPSGNQIAFVSDRLGIAQIFAMNRDGSNVRRLSFQGGRSTDPQWSPDGTRIAYVVEKSGEGAQVYIMGANGENAQRVTFAGGSCESPSWSADSRYIIYSATRPGSNLWTVNLETGEERPVRGLTMGCQGPSWGPRRPLASR